jgi:uncharacterized protein (TIGR02147 family)
MSLKKVKLFQNYGTVLDCGLAVGYKPRQMTTALSEIRDYREWLAGQLSQRRRRIPSYSLRSFARKLGLSPTSLSQILAGKRPLSQKAALKIAERLDLDARGRRALLHSALSAKIEALETPVAGSEKNEKLELDTFQVISEWQHFAILNLLLVDHVRSTPKAMATRLGITLDVCEQALLRLRRLGMVERTPGGYRRTVKRLETPTDIPSPYLKKFYRQLMVKAGESLDRDPVTDRDFRSITMAINPDNLPRAKEIIRNFIVDLSDLLEMGGRKRVYLLQTQLFPLDHKGNVK